MFGSAYADMRLMPYVFAVALLAIRFRDATDVRAARSGSPSLGLAFVLVRIAGTTASLAIASNDQQAKLAALDHVPMGARVVSLVGDACGGAGRCRATPISAAMVIVRRHGFSNDQWVIEGANLLQLRYREAGIFAADPSQIVRPNAAGRGRWMDRPRAAGACRATHFDYLWLIDPPPFDPELVAGMQPVWRGPGSILYRLQP